MNKLFAIFVVALVAVIAAVSAGPYPYPAGPAPKETLKGAEQYLYGTYGGVVGYPYAYYG